MFITVGKNRINLNNINYCTEFLRPDEYNRPIRALGISFGETHEGTWDLVLKGEEVDIFLTALESQHKAN